MEQTKQLYELMYDLGCKGGTIYRDGSRDEQILAVDHSKLGKDVKEQIENQAAKAQAAPEPSPEPTPAPTPAPTPHPEPVQPQMARISPRKRPDVMHGSTYKITTAYGNLYVTVNEDEHGAFEVFSQLGKAGGFFSAQTEAICRMISLSLRSGISLQDVIDQLKGIRGPDPVFHNGERILSLPDAMANVLESHIKRGQAQLPLDFSKTESPAPAPVPEAQPVFQTISQETHDNGTAFVRQKSAMADSGHAPVCMMCGDMLRMAEGCQKCESCGWSKC